MENSSLTCSKMNDNTLNIGQYINLNTKTLLVISNR